MSRALVHAYLGDRRGLIDAVQVRIIGRLDTWVGHGLKRATTRDARLAALVHGVFAYVDDERDAWGVLAASGGFDHPALHGVRGRWAAAASVDDDPADVPAHAAVSALLGGVGTWVNRGVEAGTVLPILGRLLVEPPPPTTTDVAST
ncbi:MAG: hypothetical protein JWM89_1936 [Acidimicrobiales bacterium]|nr:hypothetical protein [Acidimicrobiales bacterium]